MRRETDNPGPVFPDNWIAPGWSLREIVDTYEMPDGGTAVLAGGVLNDKTNLLGLAFPGGQFLLRIPPTGEMEERFTGRPLGPGEASLLAVWRRQVHIMAQLRRELHRRQTGRSKRR